MVSGQSWNESSFSWDGAINGLKKFSNSTYGDLVDLRENEIEDSGLKSDEFESREKHLKVLIGDIVDTIGTKLSKSDLEKEIDELIAFEKNVDELRRKHKKFQRIFKGKKNKALQNYNKNILWMNFLLPFLAANQTNYEGEIEDDFESNFLEFMQTTPYKYNKYLPCQIFEIASFQDHCKLLELPSSFEKHSIPGRWF